MFDRSFRLVASCVARPVVFAIILPIATILAGCGGSGARPANVIVSGAGYRFAAPKGWTVVRDAGKVERVTASSGPDLVQVASFTLLKTYSPRLFRKVEPELRTRMEQVAAQSGGSVAGSGIVAVSGIRSHTYRVRASGNIDEYTFVLQGRREYLLLCRRPAAGDGAPCRQLVATFTLG